MACHFAHGAGWSHPSGPMLGAVTASDPAAGQSIAPHTEPGAGRPVRTAAFFDLDKTVIAKSSTLAFSKPFFDQGLINRRAVLKSTYAQFFFLMSGADHDQMDRMRSYVTNMCAGWDVEQVKSIVGETLHDIVDPLVFAEAANLIADHKLCGRDVVIVSASGEEIVAPIARAVWRHPRHGHPDGRRGRQVHRRGGVLLLSARARSRPFVNSPPARDTPSSTVTHTPTRSPTCRCWRPSAIRPW